MCVCVSFYLTLKLEFMTWHLLWPQPLAASNAMAGRRNAASVEFIVVSVVVFVVVNACRLHRCHHICIQSVSALRHKKAKRKQRKMCRQKPKKKLMAVTVVCGGSVCICDECSRLYAHMQTTIRTRNSTKGQNDNLRVAK